MRVSALRLAACAGLFVGVLTLASSGVGLAHGDPSSAGHDSHQRESSKSESRERPSLSRVIDRILSEHRKRAENRPRMAPRAKIGSDPDSGSTASEANAATLAEPEVTPDPELVPDNERGAEPAGSEEQGGGDGGPAPAPTQPEGGGSDHVDNTVVAQETPTKSTDGSVVYPYPYYWLELRRGGGDWWNVERIVSRIGEAIGSPYLAATTRAPEPEPEPAPAPAFRGPAPQAPAPEPVLDASGGVSGGGSDYRATGFGAAPVLTAPIVAAPLPPPAAARFPAFPPVTAPAPSVGSAAARGGYAEPAPAVAARQAGTPEQAPSSSVTSMSGQSPRRGYTDYLRSPGLPQLAGAALPGVAGILLLTIGGGVVGYRQANAGRMIRTSAAARYLP